MINSIFIIFIKVLFYSLLNSQNIQIKAWIEEGYYYSHRCQITLEIVSDYFESEYQLFHVFAKQNINFFLTEEYLNVFYVKGSNSMQQKMTPRQKICKFPMSTTYYCPVISTVYNPLNIDYFQMINSTHRKMTFRINRAICSSQGSKSVIRVQMPAHQDYNLFYLFVGSLTDSSIVTVDKLSFVYDKQIQINTDKLRYKQIKQISYIQPVNYLKGCKFVYPIKFIFQNLTYYDSWNIIDIYISNQQILSLSTQCQSNLLKQYICTRTNYGYQLINVNSTDMTKSYQIAEQQYYENSPIQFSISFGMQFIKPGISTVQVVCKSFNNKIQQSWLNMSHENSQIYGRKQNTIRGYQESQFIKIQQYSTVFNPLKCIDPISINKITNNTITSNSTNTTIPTNTTNTTNTSQNVNTTNSTSIQQNSSSLIDQNQPQNNQTNQQINNETSSNNTFSFNSNQMNNSNINANNSTYNNSGNNNSDYNYFYDFNFQTIDTSVQMKYVATIFGIFLVVFLILLFRETISQGEKLLYLLTTLAITVLKIVFLSLGINQSWLVNPESLNSTDSSIINSKNSSQSFQLFMIKNTFYLQFIIGIIYFLNYLLIFIFSTQLTQRIKRFYGTRINYYNKKQNKYNFGSILFIATAFMTFLINYKVYGIFIFKLHGNVNAREQMKEFKKYRFRNSVLYRIYYGHLGIDLIFGINYLIWLLLLIKRCEYQVFSYFIKGFFVVGCIELFLTVTMLKSFYYMARINDDFNNKESSKFINKSTLLQIKNNQEQKQLERQALQQMESKNENKQQEQKEN